MMKLRLTCREVTRLVLAKPERPWTWLERLVLQMHWWACEGCTRFRRQADLLGQASGRWRQYRDGSDDRG